MRTSNTKSASIGMPRLKANDSNTSVSGAGRAQQILDLAAQLGGTDQAGVEHQGLVAQFGQQLAPVLDGVGQRAVLVVGLLERERVHAPRFRKTAHQGVGGGVEKHRGQVDLLTGLVLQLCEPAGQAGQRRGTAHIHGDGHLAGAVALLQRDERLQQFRRQVVHAVKAQVFQRGERHRLART
jgi:hypothetical protein